MNTKAAEAFARARSNLLLDHFFFGRLALYLKPVQKEDIPTLAVDGKHLFYNPQFFLDLPRPLQKSAIAHEVMHCVMQHILRRKGRDQKLWNRACDYAENRVLQDSGQARRELALQESLRRHERRRDLRHPEARAERW